MCVCVCVCVDAVCRSVLPLIPTLSSLQSEVMEPFLGGLRNHSLPRTFEELISVVPEGVDTGQVGVVTTPPHLPYSAFFV